MTDNGKYMNKGKLVILPAKMNMNSEIYYNAVLNDHGYPMHQKVTEKRDCHLAG